MALGFADAKGSSGGDKLPDYKYVDGEQTVRAISGIVARYMYWVPNPKAEFDKKATKEIPFEALQFNRETQEWDNSIAEPVKEMFPDLKPKWSYVSLLMTPNGEIKVWYHKKKLLDQIKDAADSLGDPTDLDNGWWIVFKRRKTGPLAINVEYSLDPLKCQKKVGPLSEDQKEQIAGLKKTIEEMFPRPTEEELRKSLEKLMSSSNDSDAGVDQEAVDELEGNTKSSGDFEIT